VRPPVAVEWANGIIVYPGKEASRTLSRLDVVRTSVVVKPAAKVWQFQVWSGFQKLREIARFASVPRTWLAPTPLIESYYQGTELIKAVALAFIWRS
jgi:hypothetical protein